jgi:hypothetical protein
VADVPLRCPACGLPHSADAATCPSCGTALDRPPSPDPDPEEEPADAAAARPRSAEAGLAPDLAHRFSKLQQWAEAVQPLGISLPVLPRWAEEAARRGSDPERWADVLRGIERLAQARILSALDEWQRDVRTRLTRLEAYAVDSRLEREQMEDALHFAKVGDISRALGAFQQVDRVISLKERHLDTAREELESGIALLKDMAALGLPIPQNPDELGRDLERELRSGHLASLKQQLRALRAQSLDGVKAKLPGFVSQYGDFLMAERAQGIAVDREIAELGRSARMLAQGRIEDSLRCIRKLLAVHGTGTFRAGRARPPAAQGLSSPTGPARRS